MNMQNNKDGAGIIPAPFFLWFISACTLLKNCF